jgi:C-methyltransferase C-terminal domain
LQNYADAGLSIAGYGAPSKAPVLLALSRVDRSLLPYTVDLSPAKSGRRIPGAGVPIHPVSTLVERRPDVIVILTWDIAEEVTTQLRKMLNGHRGWSPTLYVPLPEPREEPI